MAVIASLWPGPARRKSANGDAPLRQRTATTGAIVDFYYGYIDAVADYLFQNHALGEFTGCATNAPDDSQRAFSSSRSFVKTRPALQERPELIARTLSEKFSCNSRYDV